MERPEHGPGSACPFCAADAGPPAGTRLWQEWTDNEQYDGDPGDGLYDDEPCDDEGEDDSWRPEEPLVGCLRMTVLCGATYGAAFGAVCLAAQWSAPPAQVTTVAGVGVILELVPVPLAVGLTCEGTRGWWFPWLLVLCGVVLTYAFGRTYR